MHIRQENIPAGCSLLFFFLFVFLFFLLIFFLTFLFYVFCLTCLFLAFFLLVFLFVLFLTHAASPWGKGFMKVVLVIIPILLTR